MDFFDDLRYSSSMAPRRIAVLDPIACCSPVRSDSLDEDQAEILAQSFAALADPIRLRLLSFIASAATTRCAPAISSNRPAAPSRRSATT